MKRILCLILAVVMMCTLLCGCNSKEEQSTNETTKAGKVESTAKTEYSDAGLYQDGVRVMTWEEVLTDVGYKDFDKETIESVSQSNDVISYSTSYFEKLEGELILPEGVKTIKDSAFLDCKKLTRITLPESLKKIEDSAFQGCSKIDYISIEASVNKIGVCVFEGCDSLTSIFVDNDKYYTDLLEDGTNDAVLYENLADGGTKLVSYPCGKKNKEYVVPWHITEIGEYAFANNSTLTKVVLSGKLEKIDAFAFLNSSVREVIIPDNVSEIKEHAFDTCKITEIVLPKKLRIIENGVFQQCENLTKVTIPDGVTKIKSCAFALNNLSSIIIPASVTEIDENALQNGITTIYGKAGSYAETFAKANNIEFIAE